jgi:biotin transport system permease protein
MLAPYIPGRSPVHRASAGLKLALLAIAGATITLVHQPMALAAALAIVAALYALAGLSLRDALRALAPVLVTIALFAALQIAFAGYAAALATLLRATSLVLLAALVTFTTRFADMIDTLTALASPLAWFGLSPAKTGLALALAIRFISVLMKDYRDIQDARAARGGSAWGVLALGPLLIKTLRMTSDLSDAIAARGFEARDTSRSGGK